MENYTPTDEEAEVIRIMNSEKADWEEGCVWVTDKVQYVMKNVVKKARKNYFGIFNQPKNPITGRDKIFIPFTEWTVETMLKNIDLDVNDIGVKSTTPEGHLKAMVFRMILHKKLNDVRFGKTLNKWLKRCAIDGSAGLEARTIDGKLDIGIVDRLDVIADPSVENLSDSSGITVRTILSYDEFQKLELENSEMVEGKMRVDRTDMELGSGESQSQIPYVEMFVRYGYLPVFIKTGEEEDKKKYFYAKVTMSGLNDTPVIHMVEDAEQDPYCWGKLKEVPNRLDGRGIGEMLFNIQAYVNEVVNTRMDKARIVQLGLFKMTGNVTPQQFKRLFTTGGIKLDQNSDISPLDTGNIDPSSYNDEQSAYTWGNRVTGTTHEDEVAGNKPATNALIEERGAGKGYNMRIEDLMLELSYFIEKKVIPIIKEEMRNNKYAVERITGDPEIIEKLDKAFARNAVRNMPEQSRANMEQAGITEDEMVEATAQNIKGELGQDRYMPIIDELFDTDYDVEIVITDESINKAAMAKMLQDTIGLLANAGLPIRNTIKELYDTLGLNGEHLIQEMPQQAPQQPGQPGQENGAGSPAQQISQQMPQ